ncbi:PilZ domain protein [Pseudooceanicola marinus]|uniref:PilZ domain protein n=1 Tax=Pseudooceanicola marinus TaxID=396013 RepID=A0A1X6ZE80_9RHOB|nr:PilZ domain-containing protein [Pseudooceanicola marinus]SLN49076.1 PilZ domain protein [Pseudooceanicola marinus]
MSIVLPPQNQQNRRRFPRYPLRRPCSLTMGDLTISAMLVDISLGGAGICLPMHVANYGASGGTPGRMLFRLEDVGHFRASPRWSSDRRMGLEFAPVAHRAPALLNLLAELEETHAGAPPLVTAGDDLDFARVTARGHGRKGAAQAAALAAREALIRRSGATPQP